MSSLSTAPGKVFDPELHEAFGVVDAADVQPGTIHSAHRRGYFWNDKLLRAALVVVAQ